MARSIHLLLPFLLAGCVYHSSTSWLLDRGDRKIEFTGYSVDPRHEGDVTTVDFGRHTARFEPERIEVDGRDVWTGPYTHARVSRGRDGRVVMDVK